MRVYVWGGGGLEMYSVFIKGLLSGLWIVFIHFKREKHINRDGEEQVHYSEYGYFVCLDSLKVNSVQA